jgi:hypothetical protein
VLDIHVLARGTGILGVDVKVGDVGHHFSSNSYVNSKLSAEGGSASGGKAKSEKRSASREAQGGSAQQENMRGGKTKTQNSKLHNLRSPIC